MVTPSHTIRITFNKGQTNVSVDEPEILAGVEARFRLMLASGTSRTEERRLSLRRVNGTYQLQRGPEAESTIHLQSPEMALSTLNHAVVVSLIEANAHLVWLHAAAVACRDRALLLVGQSGQGKSSLVTRLYQRGWPYLADDVIPLDPATDRAWPFPQTPYVRPHLGRTVGWSQLHALEKRPVELDPARVCREAQPVGALILPNYQASAPTELVGYAPSRAVLALLHNCASLPRQQEAAVEYLVHLAGQRPAFRLTYSDLDRAVESIVEATDAGKW